MDLKKFSWIRNPKDYTICNDKITITTNPNTDLWQKTYYHFINDNAPMLLTETQEKFFSFTVKTEFSDSKVRFDQCGIIVYLNSENWLKASAEYENTAFSHLGSVVTTNGYSDWATTEISTDIKTIWYRLSRREDDFCIEYSLDGVIFHQMRICHLLLAKDNISFGIYACSPENSSFTATFTNFNFGECVWKAHNGEQPNMIN